MSDGACPDPVFVADRLRERFGEPPAAFVVLGSGLGAVADRLGEADSAPYEDVGLPGVRVAGHSGRVVVGSLAGRRLAAFSGRVHVYEGHPAASVAATVRAAARWGAPRAILTSAVGSLDPAVGPGSLVRLTDHVNLSGENPLVGPHEPAWGARFPDMTRAYDPDLGRQADLAAARLGIPMARGVYMALKGPSYETPAEIRMLRAMGGAVVGMSVVHEVIALAQMAVPVLAISVVSNLAAGLSKENVDHGRVTEVMAGAADPLVRLIKELATGW